MISQILASDCSLQITQKAKERRTTVERGRRGRNDVFVGCS